MKEDLGELWAQPSKRHAARFLDDWVARAHASGVRILKKFANTLQLHRKGLLALKQASANHRLAVHAEMW
jgi:hypothetical protein